ncbi:hypothetical protein [Halegenticoccus tardaugens]|uniref:hypothetical protein n=1 Tax=Halegenticoccus tardaugens TaxID=2071624 RepID=UPI00100B4FF0|nr:hypothetical protein [Halegenticoccus tardaugens]
MSADTLSELRGKRPDILAAIEYFGSEADATEISDKVEIPEGSRGHLFGDLEDRGLIRMIGEHKRPSGSYAYVYSLTERGAVVLDEYEEARIAQADVDALRKRVASQQEQIGRLRERLNDAYRELEHHDDKFATVDERTKDLNRRLKAIESNCENENE